VCEIARQCHGIACKLSLTAPARCQCGRTEQACCRGSRPGQYSLICSTRSRVTAVLPCSALLLLIIAGAPQVRTPGTPVVPARSRSSADFAVAALLRCLVHRWRTDTHRKPRKRTFAFLHQTSFQSRGCARCHTALITRTLLTVLMHACILKLN
jgi:hypothetical protein